tara:strand:+ start:1991 stop:2362 length:372 start_codon:yes stop_codon:yes gene_type:complete
MNNLIIDAANEYIFLSVIINNKSYTSEYINNRDNFDKLSMLIFSFLEVHKIKIENIEKIFINQGPGKFSGIRASLATAKALSLTNKIELIGFSSKDVFDKNYEKILDLYNKGLLNKNLIKPIY